MEIKKSEKKKSHSLRTARQKQKCVDIMIKQEIKDTKNNGREQD